MFTQPMPETRSAMDRISFRFPANRSGFEFAGGRDRWIWKGQGSDVCGREEEDKSPPEDGIGDLEGFWMFSRVLVSSSTSPTRGEIPWPADWWETYPYRTPNQQKNRPFQSTICMGVRTCISSLLTLPRDGRNDEAIGKGRAIDPARPASR